MKVIAFIFSFYILFCAVFPCFFFDNCEQEEHTAGSAEPGEHNNCKGCSPFSICSVANGFTLTNNDPLIEPGEFYIQVSYNSYYFSFTSEYYSSLFQPPRSI